jgi:CRISPR/Cas system-associated exonuclease Cas4 (RecB family)
MTLQSMGTLIIKRCLEVKKIIDAKELADKGYSPLEIADYMYCSAMAQVKMDIIPITIAETTAETGASPEYLTEVMKKYLQEKGTNA